MASGKDRFGESFSAKHLCSWETPSSPKQLPKGVKYETKPYNTKPIVDEKGHLLPGVPKKQKSAFISNPGPGSPRWPSPDPTKPKPSSATMGYKGIQTETYLPMSTVPLPTTCMRTNTR